jgi:hypothetical protein
MRIATRKIHLRSSGFQDSLTYFNIFYQKQPFVGKFESYHPKTLSLRDSISRSIVSVSSVAAWLPDVIFSNKKSKFALILEGLATEDVRIFYVHCEYFGIFSSFWHIFPHFGMLKQDKSGNPGWQMETIPICT